MDNINLEWERGILGIIGPNGAGKSTLIKIMSTIIFPTSGDVQIFGYDLAKDPLSIRQRLGVCFENPSYPPSLRVFSSLQWVGQIRGLSKTTAKRQTLDLLNYFDLLAASELRLKELSAGMRQKYGLIQATIGFPSLIILDEPTSNLDPDGRKNYETYVQTLVREYNCTVIIASHVLGELNRICDGFFFLFNGKCAEFGTRQDLLTKYPAKRYRLLTHQPQLLASLLQELHIEIVAQTNSELEIRVQNSAQLLEIQKRFRNSSIQENKVEELIFLPVEVEIEAIYQQLRTHPQKRTESNENKL
ncbi:MAG: ABC transporter ATP-binding protein [Candidatus Thorarchaeota archaeon]